VFPNPKTSGNGRYTYLAAYGYAQNHFGKDNESNIDDFLSTFLKNVAVFDTGGRGATTTFVERGIGDVLITFESEVNNIRNQYGADQYEVVVPKTSYLGRVPGCRCRKKCQEAWHRSGFSRIPKLLCTVKRHSVC